MIQSLVLGVVYDDIDRGNCANIIVSDLAQEKPSGFHHIDFEYAQATSYSDSHHELMLKICNHYDQGFDMQFANEVEIRFRKLADDLRQNKTGIALERSAYYLDNIESYTPVLHEIKQVIQENKGEPIRMGKFAVSMPIFTIVIG